MELIKAHSQCDNLSMPTAVHPQSVILITLYFNHVFPRCLKIFLKQLGILFTFNDIKTGVNQTIKQSFLSRVRAVIKIKQSTRRQRRKLD